MKLQVVTVTATLFTVSLVYAAPGQSASASEDVTVGDSAAQARSGTTLLPRVPEKRAQYFGMDLPEASFYDMRPTCRNVGPQAAKWCFRGATQWCICDRISPCVRIGNRCGQIDGHCLCNDGYDSAGDYQYRQGGAAGPETIAWQDLGHYYDSQMGDGAIDEWLTWEDTSMLTDKVQDPEKDRNFGKKQRPGARSMGDDGERKKKRVVFKPYLTEDMEARVLAADEVWELAEE